METHASPACRDRARRTVLLTFRAGADGTRVPRGPTRAPAPCPRCGQVPEQIIEVVETVVTTREEVQRLVDQGRIEKIER